MNQFEELPPITADDVRMLVGSDLYTLHYGRADKMPDDDDTYTMSAHDLVAVLRRHSEHNEAATEAATIGEEASFEAWWDAKIAANGGHLGAEYRHWARAGWIAAARGCVLPNAEVKSDTE